MSRFDRFLNWLLMKFLPYFDIVKQVDGETTLYLRRFYLKDDRRPDGSGKGIFIHYIARSDDDPDPHDHPWDFTSIVLGRYRDEQWMWKPLSGRRVFLGHEKVAWRVVRRAAEHIHRLVLDRPAWSIVFTGPKRREWTFVTDDGPVHWRKYLKLEDGDTNHA